MSEITSLFQLDLNGTYSYADYLAWRFKEAIEIVKDRILQMAAPSTKHQRMPGHLTLAFGNRFKDQQCQAFAVPFDVRLYDKRKPGKASKDIFSG